MEVKECSFPKCELHDFVVKALENNRESTDKLSESQLVLKENATKLTENLLELQRSNERLTGILHDYRLEQKDFKERVILENKELDKRIQKNDTFVQKAVAIIGATAFFAIISPGIIWLIRAVIKLSD